MAKRSPILGYNHNFRHRGLIFHVQTEDSGIDNPHIFTHLFNGGVILSTRKLTYDAGSAEEVVKALMQAQHKAMLKDLKRGTFDDKIDNYFGDRPELEPRPHDTLIDMPAHRPPAAAREPSPEDLEVELELSADDIEIIGGPADTLRNAPPASMPRNDSAPVLIHAEEPDAVPQRPGAYAQHRTGSHEIIEESGPNPSAPTGDEPKKPRTSTAEKVRTPRTSSPPPKVTPGAAEIAAELEGSVPVSEPEVVVSRPSVIVGAPPKVVGGKPPPSRRAREGSASLFGKDLISEKSLDEVILAYLSEDGSGRDGGG